MTVSAGAGPTAPSRARLLVFVVAYEAESTLAGVLARIPASVFDLDVEVLVIDDGSRDQTFEVARRSVSRLPYRLTVLANRVNQGYGGNQKLGYEYAIRHGFDFVLLLHGDGQYAPERIPALIQPLLDDDADAVLGSRMLERGAARRGGMPLYKRLGNRILTWIQNRLLRTALSEFHSGFRAYRVAALSRLPFEHNASVFHFDTEIIIQFLLAGLRIVEVAIPTYYGDEICRVNGLRYARDVVVTTARARLHQWCIFYDRKFDVVAPTNAHYGLKLGYASSHTAALAAVPPGARVLDVGCGPGLMARELRGKGCVVDGADQDPPADASAFREFIVWREPEPLAVDVSAYDVVLLLDIVEHLREPERFLDTLRRSARSLDGNPPFIITTGNVAFIVLRLQLLLGSFNYGKRGILDITHTRLYTLGSLRNLFEQCGFRVERTAGIPAPFPVALGRGRLPRLLVQLNAALIRLLPRLFAYQFLMVAHPLPTADSLLDDTLAHAANLGSDAL
jgi:glycosyltransferase involved in cell wall biosynthesis